ncbi:MAG: type I methionyl aminopeptidase [Candidatus Omnitrophica bacterium]|nr:type I methionyl aminopeptidase [Candidatus Omnitrophota bacterium]
MTTVLSKDERRSIRKAGSILSECMDLLSKEIKVGVSTKALEQEASRFIASRNARPAFLGYKGYPAAICTSRNNVVVHGIPSDKDILASGDIVGIDIGVEYEGYFADAARTFAVGNVSKDTRRLISIAREALYEGIEKACVGNRIHDISWAVQSFVEANGFNIVRAFVGHGIGKKIHEDPEIPNFGKPHTGRILEDGMVLAIEPMVNVGTADVKVLGDGWTAVTSDSKLSAHFEHTVIVDGKIAEVIA